MKILITGSKGQLGRELSDIFLGRGHEVVAFSKSDLDVSDASAVDRRIERCSPELIVNAAAYTNVDGCETNEELAYQINALGPRNLAQVCERRGCELLHVSTNTASTEGATGPTNPSTRHTRLAPTAAPSSPERST